MFPSQMQGKLLDIGAYQGAMRKMIPQSITYQGIDIVGKAELDIMEWDLNAGKLPFDSEDFDYVLCCEVLEHTFYPEEIAKEIARVLKPTGIAIISLPNDLGINGRFNAFFRHPRSLDEQKYYHHWFFTLQIAREFIGRFFEISEERLYLGQAAKRFIPHFFLKLTPGICSCIFMKVRKRIDSNLLNAKEANI